MSLPFPGAVTATANGLLLLSLIAAVLYGLAQAREPSWRRSVAKTAAVGLLAVLSAVERGPLLLTAALALGAVGDAALAQRGERAFLAGLAAFLLAHLAYVALFATRWQGWDIVTREPWRMALGLALLAVCAFMAVRLRPAVGDALRLPVAAYTAAILAMGLAALLVPGWGIAAGAALFVASDALLATRKFLLAPEAAAGPRLGWAVWASYYLAQALIALILLT
ncbi:MAG: lysoplasmalogenase [Rhizobiales bacterium]|nr:lysoplasmalogenase [Hyphomicrobiales bacterium]OJU35143.1 MAG: hypothetical protein BGN94_01115 [Rhizobiales bacterium 68-8]